MSGTVTLDQLKHHTRVTDSQLAERIHDDHLDALAPHIANWYTLASCLGLKDHEKLEIKCDNTLDYLNKNRAVLRVWKKSNVMGATYLALVRTAQDMSDGQLAIEICELAKRPVAAPNSLDRWFREVGLTDRDIEKLHANGLSTEQAFKLLTLDDLKDLGLTLGGRKLLKPIVEANMLRPPEPDSQDSSNEPQILQVDTHLGMVLNHTYKARTKWHMIGLQLGLEPHTLESIQRMPSCHDDGDYYREMLVKWMHRGQAKMVDLLAAFEAPTVDREDAVKDVNKLSAIEKKSLGL